jgi:hypothetical protein
MHRDRSSGARLERRHARDVVDVTVSQKDLSDAQAVAMHLPHDVVDL